MEEVLRQFAEENFEDDNYYPVFDGQTALIKPLALAVKKRRSIFLRPFFKSELIVTAPLEDCLPQDRKEGFVRKVSELIQKETGLNLDTEKEDEEQDEGDSSSLDIRLEAGKIIRVNVETSDEMGELELGKLDMEYVKDPDLRELLAETSLDSNKMKGIENQKLRLIYDVVYSERFELKGQRGDEVTVDAGLEANLLQTGNPANILAARLKGFYKKKAIPPTIATRNERGPVFFKCVHVDYDKATGKLNLGEEEVVGQSTHRDKEVDKDYQETMVASEIERSDWTDNDFKKLETIEKVVLMSSANREKRKERVRKYRQWFEKALAEDKTTLTLTEPLTDEDHRFIKEIFLPPHSDELIVDLSSFETEKIQGYAIVLKKINDLSDEDWDEIEKAWAEAGQDKRLERIEFKSRSEAKLHSYTAT